MGAGALFVAGIVLILVGSAGPAVGFMSLATFEEGLFAQDGNSVLAVQGGFTPLAAAGAGAGLMLIGLLLALVGCWRKASSAERRL